MKKQGTKQPGKEVTEKEVSLAFIFLILWNFTGSKKDMILTESDIPAKEIKLAKILMDKPAPHCSAQSWAIFD